MERNIFIKRANIKHNNKYEYRLIKEINIDLKSIGTFICPTHGKFKQIYKNHLYYGCSQCSGNITNTNENFKKDSIDIHGDEYDYSLINYRNNKTKVKIICSKHGIFEKTYQEHIRLKQGCPKCSRVTDKESFIEKANIIHNNKYDYAKFTYISARNMATIICPIHGEFEQITYSHLNGTGCPKCKKSKGELKIEKYLLINSIDFESQKTFEDCKNINYLPFDFYIFDQNICIEFDGKQHFENNT